MPVIRTKNRGAPTKQVKQPKGHGPAVGFCPKGCGVALVPRTLPNGTRVGHCTRCGKSFQAINLDS